MEESVATRTVKSLNKSGRISRLKAWKAIREIQESPEYRILLAKPTGKITRKTTATGKGLVRFRVFNFKKFSTRSTSD
jgi:hypothetical protein